jgi:GTP-binding protein EngB required for normal cell division
MAIHFLLGSMLLPNADFDVLGEVPQMYRHCKEMEDKDMNFFDFITDHLVNIDGIFDKHDKNDDQKPHKYPHYQHVYQLHIANYFASSRTEKFIYIKLFEKMIFPESNLNSIELPSYIFRPPIS